MSKEVDPGSVMAFLNEVRQQMFMVILHHISVQTCVRMQLASPACEWPTPRALQPQTAARLPGLIAQQDAYDALSNESCGA